MGVGLARRSIRFAGVGAALALALSSARTDAAEQPSGDLPPARAPGPKKHPQRPAIRPANLFSRMSRGELDAELQAAHAAGGSFPELIERVSRGLLSAPYLLSPLGEGVPPDPDPRFRLDAFDCTTLVETTIALAREDHLAAVETALDHIRYKGDAVRFGERRHLMTSQWVPGLIEAGILEDVTRSVGGEETRSIRLVLTDARWKKRRIARGLDLLQEEVPKGSFELPYVPISALIGRTDDVPPGLVLNVIRADVPWSPEVITHQALVLTRPKDQVRVARHASPVAKRVIDEPLAHMIARYSKPNGWPILGINLLRVIDPRKVAGRPN